MSAIDTATDVRPLVVITDSDFGDHAIEADVLEPTFELRRAAVRSTREIVEIAADAVALLVQWARIEADVLDSLPHLKVVVRYGAGLDNIDVQGAEKRGIIVRNVDDYCLEEVADHATAAIASAQRRLPLYDAAVKSGTWGPASTPAPLPVVDDPVGVAGYGRIGSLLCAKVAAIGHPVVVWDAYASDRIARDGFAEAPDLETLADQVNHLSLHLPLTLETAGIVSSEVLRRLGPVGHLVNHARGALLDEPAVLAWLDANEFATASLDVFVHEPPFDTSIALARHPRVTASPHVAYLSTDSLPRLRRRAAQHVLEALIE